jgi:hypothetical protein
MVRTLISEYVAQVVGDEVDITPSYLSSLSQPLPVPLL